MKSMMDDLVSFKTLIFGSNHRPKRVTKVYVNVPDTQDQ